MTILSLLDWIPWTEVISAAVFNVGPGTTETSLGAEVAAATASLTIFLSLRFARFDNKTDSFGGARGTAVVLTDSGDATESTPSLSSLAEAEETCRGGVDSGVFTSGGGGGDDSDDKLGETAAGGKINSDVAMEPVLLEEARGTLWKGAGLGVFALDGGGGGGGSEGRIGDTDSINETDSDEEVTEPTLPDEAKETSWWGTGLGVFALGEGGGGVSSEGRFGDTGPAGATDSEGATGLMLLAEVKEALRREGAFRVFPLDKGGGDSEGRIGDADPAGVLKLCRTPGIDEDFTSLALGFRRASFPRRLVVDDLATVLTGERLYVPMIIFLKSS